MQKIFVLLIAVLIISCNSNIDVKLEKKSKYDEIITKYTEIKQIFSKEVNDTFLVYVRLPKFYSENPNKRYPVLYLLDGDISFNMATSIIRYLQFEKSVPDLIIIAPAYGTLLSDKETNYRERDYTISKVEKFQNSGGGENYLSFLKNELIPIVDSYYRTSKKRILNGYSLGGLFTLNTLLNKPELFTDYIAGSPYLNNDFDSINAKIQSLFLNDEKKLFLSVGELEEKEFYHIPINSVYNLLKSKNNLKTIFRTFEDGTHFTCPSEALTYGLRFVFSTTTSEEQE